MKTVGHGLATNTPELESRVRVTRLRIADNIVDCRRTIRRLRDEIAQRAGPSDHLYRLMLKSRQSEVTLNLIVLRGLSRCLRGKY